MTYPHGSTGEELSADDLAHALQQAHEGWALDLSPGCAAVMAERLLERFDFRHREDAPASARTAEEEATELRGELRSRDATLTNLRGAHLNLQNDYHRALQDTYAVHRVRAIADRLAVHGRLGVDLEADGIRRGIADQLHAALRERTTKDRHPFEQDPQAEHVLVCRCSKWPDHHIHGGEQTMCSCDTCRTTRTTTTEA